MKIGEIRSLDDVALKARLLALWRRLFDLRVQKVTDQRAPIHEFKQLRRAIARIKTVLRERRVSGSFEAGSVASHPPVELDPNE